MRRLFPLFVVIVAAATVGCGAESKVAGVPSDQQVEADKAHQKAVEDEEKGGAKNRR